MIASIMCAAHSRWNGKDFLEFPKCLIIYRGEVLLERQVRLLKKCGIEKIKVLVSYKKESIISFGTKNNLDVEYVYNPNWEDVPSSLKLLLDDTDDNLLIYGDVWITEKAIKGMINMEEPCGIGYGIHERYKPPSGNVSRHMFKIGKDKVEWYLSEVEKKFIKDNKKPHESIMCIQETLQPYVDSGEFGWIEDKNLRDWDRGEIPLWI